ncbi:MAG: twin-arginine translocase subunit TatC [Victivallales bacterium]|nr:twin-arginine translocase subunit TatC [Victivallales bacterium]
MMNETFGNQKFIEHLEDLRQMLLKIVLCFTLLFPVAFFFSGALIDRLIQYSCPPGFTLHYFAPLEPFIVRVKISFFLALFAGIPYIAAAVWKFIAPGLYRREKRGVAIFAIVSWVLFASGTVFCWALIIPLMMKFSLSLGSPYVRPAIGIGNFTGLAAILLAGFGLMFQFPLVVFMLVGSGLVRLETFRKQRAIILIVILILSALLTPPDVISQIMMAVPTYLLFELSLLLGKFAGRSRGDAVAETISVPDMPQEAMSPAEPMTDEAEGAGIYAAAAKPRRRKLRARRR